MIFYNKKEDPRYPEYGILIPIKDSRSQKTFNMLKQSYPDIIDSITVSNFEDITSEDLLRTHSKPYIEGLFGNQADGLIKEGFELVDRNGNLNRFDPEKAKYPLKNLTEHFLMNIAGTYTAAKSSLNSGFSFHLGGGAHHAMSDRGRGFCMLNDMVIAIRKLQSERKIDKAIIIDMDAHKGDGSAELCEKDSSISTFSIHMKNGWPLVSKEEGGIPQSFIASDIDVAIENDQNYLDSLQVAMENINLKEFDLAIVVQGADPYEHDELESAKLIQLTKEEMLARDTYMYETLKKNSLPQTWVMAGGYGDRSWEIYHQFLNSIMEKITL